VGTKKRAYATWLNTRDLLKIKQMAVSTINMEVGKSQGWAAFFCPLYAVYHIK